MRIQSLALALATLTFTVACSNSTEPSRYDPLVGRWTTDRSALSPAGSVQYHLTFTKLGSFIAEHRSFGTYSAQQADDLSSYSRMYGTYVVEADRLYLNPKSLVSWDYSYGPNSPELVQRPLPHGTLYDAARFQLEDGLLTLHYTVYPADAPVSTSQTFRPDR